MAKYKIMTDVQAMDYIEKKGLSNMTAFELRSVGRPLMTKVKKWMRNLRNEKLQYTPAYQGYKAQNVRTTTNYADKERDKLLHEVYAAYNFLNAQTSTVYGAEKYMRNVNALFGRELTPREARKFFAALDAIKEDRENLFEMFSSDELAKEVGFQAISSKESAADIAERVINYFTIQKERIEHEKSDTFRDIDRDLDPLGDSREYWVAL